MRKGQHGLEIIGILVIVLLIVVGIVYYFSDTASPSVVERCAGEFGCAHQHAGAGFVAVELYNSYGQNVMLKQHRRDRHVHIRPENCEAPTDVEHSIRVEINGISYGVTDEQTSILWKNGEQARFIVLCTEQQPTTTVNVDIDVQFAPITSGGTQQFLRNAQQNIVVNPSSEQYTTQALGTDSTATIDPENIDPNDPPSLYLSSCGQLDIPHSHYFLENDVETEDSCFTITASGIVFDGQGHTVTYGTQQGGNKAGILASNIGGITVQNFHVVGPTQGNWNRYGIWLTNVSDASLSSITSTDSRRGLLIHDTSHSLLRDITATQNAQYGIHLDESAHLSLSSITANDNGISGLATSNSVNNTIVSITAEYNGNGIIISSFSSENHLQDVQANNNNQDGVSIVAGSSYNLVEDVQATANGRGISIQTVSGNIIRGATFTNYVSNGIYIQSHNSANNHFENIVVDQSGEYAIRVNPSSITMPVKNVSFSNVDVSSYSFEQTGLQPTFIFADDGAIRVDDAIIGTGNLFSEGFLVEHNHAFLDPAVIQPGMQAHITLSNIPEMNTPEVYHDGVPCGESCTMHSSAQGTVEFTVTQPGTYTVQDV